MSSPFILFCFWYSFLVFALLFPLSSLFLFNKIDYFPFFFDLAFLYSVSLLVTRGQVSTFPLISPNNLLVFFVPLVSPNVYPSFSVMFWLFQFLFLLGDLIICFVVFRVLLTETIKGNFRICIRFRLVLIALKPSIVKLDLPFSIYRNNFCLILFYTYIYMYFFLVSVQT